MSQWFRPSELIVRSLCEGQTETAENFETLARLLDSELAVVRLDHPPCSGYAHVYVDFYLDAFLTNSALYNMKFVPTERHGE